MLEFVQLFIVDAAVVCVCVMAYSTHCRLLWYRNSTEWSMVLSQV